MQDLEFLRVSVVKFERNIIFLYSLENKILHICLNIIYNNLNVTTEMQRKLHKRF